MVIARIQKVGAKIWEHKKKSVVAGILVVYGGNWVQRWVRNNQIREAYALEAVKYGQKAISAEERPRRVIVLANVHSNERGCYDNFVNNSLPLLHLAGIEVNIIKSDSEKQLEALGAAVDAEEADAVYIVGGDGTVGRVITGIFRNREQAILPMGIYPGGYDNLTLKSLVPAVFSEESDIRRQCESAMAIIEDSRRPVKVFRVDVENSEEPPLYSIGDLGAGWFRHIEDRRKKLWYFGGLKRRWAYVWEMLKRSPKPVECEVEYEPYCAGCNRCRPPAPIEEVQWRWWHILTGTPRYAQPIVMRDFSQVVNEECGKREQCTVSGAELRLTAEQSEDEHANLALRLRTSGNIGRFGVISEGWSRCSANLVHSSPSESYYKDDITGKAFSLKFTKFPEFIRKLFVSSDEVKDGAQEGVRVNVQAIDKTLSLFLPSQLRVDPLKL